MASIIRIKRSQTAGNPSVLGAGELAYSAADYDTVAGGGRLYIGIGTESGGDAASHLVIGGQYFTDKLDHTPGTLTANSAVIVDADKKINEFYVDGLKLDGNTISSTNTNGNILIDPNGSGYVQIVGTNALVIPSGTSLQQAPAVAGAIRLNTDTGQFEGYSGSNWSSMGGVRSVDGQTYITAELTPGASDDTLRFYTDGVLSMALSPSELEISSTVDTVTIAASTASTDYTTGALVVNGGAGFNGNVYVNGNFNALSASFASINDTPIGNITPSTGAFTQLDVDSIRIDGNTISNTTSGSIFVAPSGIGNVVGITNLAVYDPNTTSYIAIDEYIQDITGGQLVAGTAISVTYDDNAGTSTISADIATTTTLGVASFSNADFNVSSGAVELKDTVVKGVTTDSGALTPATHSFSILGGEGIDVTHSGTTITVAGEDATDANKGIASFDSGDFDVTAGHVVIKAGGVDNAQLANDSVTIGTTEIDLGATSTTLAGLTQVDIGNIRITGNEISSTDTDGDISLNPNGTGNITVNSAKITGLANPVDPQDAATKYYVDASRTGLDVKQSVRAATSSSTGNVDLATGGLLTIDGVTLVAGDRVLVKNQTDPVQNGIYVVAAGAWSRSTDADEPAEVTPGIFMFVEEGDDNEDSGWVLTSDNGALTPLTVGTDALVFNQFSGAGQIIPGDGLSKTGNQIDVNPGDGITIVSDSVTLASTVAGAGLTYTSGVLDVVGTADRITVNANSVDIASTYAGQTSITTLGTITTGTWNGTIIDVAHGGTGLGSFSYGDLLVGSVTGSLTTLTVGAEGKVLQSNGSTIIYGDVDGGTY